MLISNNLCKRYGKRGVGSEIRYILIENPALNLLKAGIFAKDDLNFGDIENLQVNKLYKRFEGHCKSNNMQSLQWGHISPTVTSPCSDIDLEIALYFNLSVVYDFLFFQRENNIFHFSREITHKIIFSGGGNKKAYVT